MNAIAYYMEQLDKQEEQRQIDAEMDAEMEEA